MQHNSFLKNGKTIINTHLKANHKIIAYEILAWFVLVVVNLFLTLLNDHITIMPVTGEGYKQSLSYILGSIVLSPIAIVGFSIICTSIIDYVIRREIREGYITLWMTSSISRTQIMMSKIIFIWLVNLMVLAPTIVPIVIFSAIATDAHLYIGDVFLQLFLFTIYMLMFTGVFVLLSTLLTEKERLDKFVIGGVILYVVATTMINNLSESKTFGHLQWMKYIKYISIQSLLVNVFAFELVVSDTEKNVVKLIMLKPQTWWIITSVFINLGLGTVITWLTVWNFKHKEFMI